MNNWYHTSLEYLHWGVNASTVGSIGIIIFTIIEAWGLYKQGQSIWHNDSGASVSVTLFSWIMFFLFAFGIYGYHIGSISMIINGLVLGLLHIPILYGLHTFKTFTLFDKWSMLIAFLMVPAMIFFENKDHVYVIIASCASLSGIMQAWEIWHKEDAGVVDIRLLSTYLGSTIFWAIYAFATQQTPLIIMTMITLVILCVIMVLWRMYRRPLSSATLSR